jgi:sortase A
VTTRQRVGGGLALAGLALLGWLGWQVLGTTLVAEHRQQGLVADLEQRFAQPEPREGSVDLPHGAFALAHLPDSLGGATVPVVEGDGEDALAWGLGHVPSTELPGQVGNVVLGGHRITHGEPLRDLAAIRPGDHIVLETAQGELTYEVPEGTAVRRVPFTDEAVLDDGAGDPAFGVGDELLTLVTCAELFHTDDRLVVSAVRVG